ncbi:MAG TPA: hypothetical protein VL201_00090 [Patescibacteria group bacterium]|nr:hypothetical protein [Patescibacteria group bacterium]
MLNVLLPLCAIEHITVQEGKRLIYQTELTIDEKKLVLNHSFPPMLEGENLFSRKEMQAVNQSNFFVVRGMQNPIDKARQFMKKLLFNNDELIDLTLKSLCIEENNKKANLIFLKKVFNSIITEKKSVGGIEKSSTKNVFSHTQIISFLPIQITPSPIVAQFNDYSESLNKKNCQLNKKITLSNQNEKSICPSLLEDARIIKQLFLDYVELDHHCGPFSLLLIGSSLSSFNDINSNEIYGISIYDCSEFAKNTNNSSPVSYLLKMEFKFLLQKTDAVNLISVKDGSCVLYNSGTQQNIVIDYKQFLVLNDCNGLIDLSQKGLDNVTCYVKQINKPYTPIQDLSDKNDEIKDEIVNHLTTHDVIKNVNQLFNNLEKKEDSFVYTSLLNVDGASSFTLTHSFPQTLQRKSTFNKQEIEYIDRYDSRLAETYKEYAPKNFKVNVEENVKPLLNFLFYNNTCASDHILHQLIIKGFLSSFQVTQENDTEQWALSKKQVSCVGLPYEQITYFLPTTITQFPFLAVHHKYDQPRDQYIDLLNRTIDLYNTKNAKETVQICSGCKVKEFFLDYLPESNQSLLIVSFIANSFFCIDLFDCSAFARGEENIKIPVILTMTIKFLDEDNATEVNTLSLASVKDGSFILYDSRFHEYIKINYKDFLSEHSTDTTIDLAKHGLKNASLTIHRNKLPDTPSDEDIYNSKDNNIRNNLPKKTDTSILNSDKNIDNIIKESTPALTKNKLTIYAPYILGSIGVLIFIYLVKYNYLCKKIS